MELAFGDIVIVRAIVVLGHEMPFYSIDTTHLVLSIPYSGSPLALFSTADFRVQG
jgi:hypothetical protein